MTEPTAKTIERIRRDHRIPASIPDDKVKDLWEILRQQEECRKQTKELQQRAREARQASINRRLKGYGHRSSAADPQAEHLLGPSDDEPP
jgi:hypothetical protein